jgi:uncharacterized cupredoxin-like copper-binding protein
VKTAFATAAAAAVALTAFSGVAGGSTGIPTLRADVAEWSIVPSVGALPAGKVRIDVRNFGTYTHQIVIVRTRTFAAQLPLRGTRAVVHPAAEPVLVRAGGHASFVVTLAPGSYVLLDNLPWHYWKGTSTAFSVR